jgi:hypothetical protein
MVGLAWHGGFDDARLERLCFHFPAFVVRSNDCQADTSLLQVDGDRNVSRRPSGNVEHLFEKFLIRGYRGIDAHCFLVETSQKLSRMPQSSEPVSFGVLVALTFIQWALFTYSESLVSFDKSCLPISCETFESKPVGLENQCAICLVVECSFIGVAFSSSLRFCRCMSHIESLKSRPLHCIDCQMMSDCRFLSRKSTTHHTLQVQQCPTISPIVVSGLAIFIWIYLQNCTRLDILRKQQDADGPEKSKLSSRRSNSGIFLSPSLTHNGLWNHLMLSEGNGWKAALPQKRPSLRQITVHGRCSLPNCRTEKKQICEDWSGKWSSFIS